MTLTALEVAEICDLTPADLYALHEFGQGMGSPGHFLYPVGGRLSYTLKGMCALIEALDATGRGVAAKALAAVLDQARGNTPAPVALSWQAEWEQRQEGGAS
jgi:hypothetical protein